MAQAGHQVQFQLCLVGWCQARQAMHLVLLVYLSAYSPELNLIEIL